MIIDEEKPKPAATTDALGVDLSRLSVTELQARVQALQAEMQRTQAEIAKKQAQNSAAEALFRK